MPAVSPSSANLISNVALDASDNNINALIGGYKWGGIVGASVTPVTVYYSFPTTGNIAYWSQEGDQYGYAFNETETFTAFSAAQQAAATSALQQWANVANINFQRVTETPSAVGDIRFGNTSAVYDEITDEQLTNMGRDDYAYAWGLREISPGVGSPDSGDIWLNRIQPVPTGNNYAVGAAGYHTILHELGHALGLDHSFSAAEGDLGVEAGKDSYQYSVMSYDSYNTNSAKSSDYGYNELYPTTLMMLDIQAIQHLYGANMKYRTGNDTYVFNSATKYLQTIWDAGGTDTIQYSSATSGVINLNQGAFSQLGKSYKVGQNPDPDPDFYSAGVAQTETVGIAYGAVIENAIGGSGNDTLIGNSANNVLDGGAGFDTLTGGAGNDTYLVDLATSAMINSGVTTTFINASKMDVVTETGGDTSDTLKLRGAATLTNYATLTLSDIFATLQNSVVYADLENLDASLTGVTKFNLYGNTANNILIGNAANNALIGYIGADTLIGGLGNDTYDVDDVGDVVTELLNAGIDTVQSSVSYSLTSINSANVENLNLSAAAGAINGTGNALANILNGNESANNLIGLAGNDILNGGAGADMLEGGDGNDVYIVDDSNDQAIETNALAAGGIDLVRSSAANFTLANYVENLTLTSNINVNGGINLNGDDDINGTGNDLANIIIGNAGNNILTGGSGADTLTGNSGSDTLVGGEGADLLTGGNGEDYYHVNLKQVGFGALSTVVLEDTVVESLTDNSWDTIHLHNSFDIAKVANILLGTAIEGFFAQATGLTKINIVGNGLVNDIEGNDANNIIYGGGGDDALGGQGGNDFLYGEAGNDRLVGYWNNDTLDGGAGVDTLEGGADNDTYLVDILAETTNAPSPIIVTGVKLQDSIIEKINEGIDTLKLSSAVTIPVAINATTISLSDNALGNLANIEHLDISATTTTRLNIVGNDANNILIGNAANNSIESGLGNDSLDGGAGNDSLVGGDGDDTLIGGLGIDTLDGGVGNDTYFLDVIKPVGIGGDVIIEDDNALNFGNDTVKTTFSADLRAVQFDGIENLTLLGVALNATGDDGNNQLTGNDGANLIDGAGGNDVMNGGKGNDTYIVDNAGDVVTESLTIALGGGVDLVKSNAFNFALTVNLENLTLTDNINLNGGFTNTNGTGNDLANIIIGNAGNNQISGGAANDTLTGNAGSDSLNGDEGNDILNGGDNNDTLTGGAGVDALTGGKGNDIYYIDLIRANALATSTIALQDTVNELANIASTNPATSMVEGIDTIILTNNTGNAGVLGSAGAPIDTSNITNATTFTVNANVENFDVSQTGAIKLNITGNVLANIIIGNDANNILDGGLNDGKIDTLIGGTGNDTYIVDLATTTIVSNGVSTTTLDYSKMDTVVETGGDTSDTLKLRGAATLTNAALISLTAGFADLENLDISLTGATKLNLTGNTANNNLVGNTANNMIDGGDGFDILDGGSGNDTLVGGNGNDSLIGGLGIDSLVGGDGDDTYVIDTLADEVNEESNADTGDTVQSANLSLDLNNIKFNGIENAGLLGTAALNLTGNNGANELTGNDGANILDGKGGGDTLDGGKGNDTYIVYNTSDVVEEDFTQLQGGGIDLVKSSADFFVLSANIENLTLTDGTTTGGTANISGEGNALANIITGNAGNNTLLGREGNDSLFGNTGSDGLYGGLGNDTLNGGEGNDNLNGGEGNDILIGGVGQDWFWFDTTLNGLTNKDTIQGFNVADDTIVLDSRIFEALSGGFSLDNYRVGAVALDANDFIINNAGNLYYDADGNGAGVATQFATLTGTVGVLGVTDFSIYTLTTGSLVGINDMG